MGLGLQPLGLQPLGLMPLATSGAPPVTNGIKLNSSLNGLGSSGPFFHDRLA